VPLGGGRRPLSAPWLRQSGSCVPALQAQRSATSVSKSGSGSGEASERGASKTVVVTGLWRAAGSAEDREDD
jgi:hypothetical protein